MEKFIKVFTLCLIVGINLNVTSARPTESTLEKPASPRHKETLEVGLANQETDTEGQISTTTTYDSDTTVYVNFADVTTNNPTEMSPTNLPASNTIERSASEETAISFPGPQEEMDPITSSIEAEDDPGVVSKKRSANTVKHYLLEREQNYHVQLNSRGKVQKHPTPTLPPWGDWTF
ncbi:unnamed protein product [Orchesella dallaii]|uniref:Uncharacterized protein n=1 Tax=Orchesella dallaii TaxID=48710 RepID=A0ABP1R951_9HEXA